MSSYEGSLSVRPHTRLVHTFIIYAWYSCPFAVVLHIMRSRTCFAAVFQPYEFCFTTSNCFSAWVFPSSDFSCYSCLSNFSILFLPLLFLVPLFLVFLCLLQLLFFVLFSVYSGYLVGLQFCNVEALLLLQICSHSYAAACKSFCWMMAIPVCCSSISL